jgi:hypothetical protein
MGESLRFAAQTRSPRSLSKPNSSRASRAATCQGFKPSVGAPFGKIQRPVRLDVMMRNTTSPCRTVNGIASAYRAGPSCPARKAKQSVQCRSNFCEANGHLRFDIINMVVYRRIANTFLLNEGNGSRPAF